VRPTNESSEDENRGRMSTLDGDWRVERAGGLLPPMAGVWKRIHGDRGESRIGPLLAWPFRVERREERVTLVYRPPFSGLVDELWIAPDGSVFGRSVLGGRELGRFRMVRSGYHDGVHEQGEVVTHEDKLRAKLIEYVQNVHALEQNVLLMLDSMIVTTKDEEIVRLLRHHKEESRRQQQRLGERLKALGGGPGLASVGKDLAAIAAAQAKGIADLWRPDKPVRNARDAFATEHLEIAAYEMLERLAERAGDEETAAVARENRAEEEAMAQSIAENWDRFLDLALAEQGIRA
jgi:ferritin-like metal-binding protein YciE